MGNKRLWAAGVLRPGILVAVLAGLAALSLLTWGGVRLLGKGTPAQQPVALRMLVPEEHTLVAAIRERALEYGRLYPAVRVRVDQAAPNEVVAAWARTDSAERHPYDLFLVPGVPKGFGTPGLDVRPWTGTFWQLYANRQLLASLPEEQRDELLHGTLPWEQFLSLLSSLKAPDVWPLAVGARYDWPLDALIEHLVGIYRGTTGLRDLAQPAENRSFDSPLITQAARALLGMMREGLINRDLYRLDWPEALKMVAESRAGFTLLSSSLVIPDDPNLVALPFPSRGSGTTGKPWIIGNLWYLTLAPDAGKQAEKLVGYLTSEGTANRLTQTTGHLFFSSLPRDTANVPVITFTDGFRQEMRTRLLGE